jgi:hypothetical protein
LVIILSLLLHLEGMGQFLRARPEKIKKTERKIVETT